MPHSTKQAAGMVYPQTTLGHKVLSVSETLYVWGQPSLFHCYNHFSCIVSNSSDADDDENNETTTMTTA